MKGIFRRLASFLLLSLLVFLGLPTLAVQAATPPEVPAEAYVVMDLATGQVLAEKNAHMAEYPASITKILTLGLVLEEMGGQTEKLGEQTQVSYRASHELIYGATHVGLSEGEMVSLSDLLYATQIESANDAANVLAEYSDGTLEGFAGRMNAKAAALGLSGSNFTNPSGQPDANHFTSAYDMAAITRWAMAVPGFRELFSATEYAMAPTNNRAFAFTCKNNNPVLSPGSAYYYPGVTGSKMGYTDDARYTLVTTAKRGDTEVVCVVLKCDTNGAKYESTTALLDYAFGNFTPAVYPAGNIPPVTVPVYGGGQDELGEITVCGGADIPFLLPNGVGLESVTAESLVPEKYVIGQPFNPVIQLAINAEGAEPIELMSAPLSWTGFDELFAANTSAWQRAIGKYPPVVLILVAVLLLLFLTVLGRVLYVRWRRHHRRQLRQAEIRAQQPISIAPRPASHTRGAPVQAPSRPSGVNRAKQFGMRTGRTGQPYIYGTSATQPRRVGRAR